VVVSFSLYEALLWEPPEGFFLLERHLARAARSGAHFGLPVDVGSLRARLADFARTLPARPRKVRLEIAAGGAVALEHVDLKPSTPVRAELARDPVDSGDELLRHKTSEREVYERALAARPGADDVLLWNERGEITETCTANVVLEIDGRRLTPHHSSGLLPGTFRGHLLERGEIEEAVLPVAAIERATRLFLINSVRRWCELSVAPAPAASSPARF
jgi:branched-subunit amino acid aminotransferase/4-amino-4-deoxychorismate lyase